MVKAGRGQRVYVKAGVIPSQSFEVRKRKQLLKVGIKEFDSELDNAKLKAEIEAVETPQELKYSRVFQLQKFTNDDYIACYTGSPN